MKNKLITVYCLCLIAICAHAQDNKQVELYQQQIAANKVLIDYLKKAYSITKTGLTTIGEIKNGDFNLHSLFFDKLKTINPTIKNTAQVSDIIVLEMQIVKNYKANFKHVRESAQFSDKEIRYIASVFSKLLDDAANTLTELYTVLSATGYQMTDDQRLKWIDILHSQMKDSYVFTEHFSKETLVMAMQRMKEKNDVDRSRDWYGIK